MTRERVGKRHSLRGLKAGRVTIHLRDALTWNWEGISRIISVEEPGQITREFGFHNLLDLISSHWADAVTGASESYRRLPIRK